MHAKQTAAPDSVCKYVYVEYERCPGCKQGLVRCPLDVLHPQLHAEVSLPPLMEATGGPRRSWCLRADRTFNLAGPVEMPVSY